MTRPIMAQTLAWACTPMLLIGCSSGSPGAKPQTSAATAPTPAGTLIPATTPLSSASLSVQVSRNLVYRAADGKASMVIQRDPPPDCVCAGRTWQVRRFDIDADASDAAAILQATPSMRPTREQSFLIVPGNAIAMVSEINREEDVEVVFDPPLVVMPDSLPGTNNNSAEFTQTLRMSVHPIGNRKVVKRAGPVKNTIRYLGDERIATPAGTFTARRVESAFEADLAPARVVNTSIQHFADGVGLVKEDERESTSALGVPIRKNADQWLLFWFAPAAPAR